MAGRSSLLCGEAADHRAERVCPRGAPQSNLGTWEPPQALGFMGFSGLMGFIRFVGFVGFIGFRGFRGFRV